MTASSGNRGQVLIYLPNHKDTPSPTNATRQILVNEFNQINYPGKKLTADFSESIIYSSIFSERIDADLKCRYCQGVGHNLLLKGVLNYDISIIFIVKEVGCEKHF